MSLHTLRDGWEAATDGEGYVTGRAQFNDARTRRYVLIRRWRHTLRDGDEGAMPLTWIMLNPSTAGAADDDATIRKCVGYAKRWGYGGIRVLNLFDVIATDPAELRTHANPSSRENDETWRLWLLPAFGGAWSTVEAKPHVVVGWGDGGAHNVAGHPGVLYDRDRQASELFAEAGIEPMCLGLTRAGRPWHPGRTSYDLDRVPWKVR